MKKVLGIYTAPRPHWVGDGFPARSVFAYNTHGAHLSPFLLMDHAGPFNFPATDAVRGVGQHPHRGFETVTIVHEGEVEHRDSTGAGGIIGPGDVQWMTAASGILHEEFHSPAFSRRGGTLDMVQLWVNLPAKDKMGAPGYQTLLDSEIPPDHAGRRRRATAGHRRRVRRRAGTGLHPYTAGRHRCAVAAGQPDATEGQRGLDARHRGHPRRDPGQPQRCRAR
ncbi:pirin family protein [Stenotrophomonas rhizophila]